MSQNSGFSLIDLDQLIPIACRNTTLTWLKGMHQAANQAIRAGYESIVMLEIGDREICADEIVELIDTVHGTICQTMAQFLIEIVKSDLMPSHLKDNNRVINNDFHQFAFGKGINQQVA